MKYEEKLNLAKKALESGSYDKNTIEYIFPELKESESERVKRILDSILSKISSHRYIFTEEEFQCFDAWIKEQCDKSQDNTNKVKPKFHEGEWIVFDGLTLLVLETVQGYYRAISNNGIYYSYHWDIDNAARLWSIQDAKDGDVLVHSKHTSDDFDYVFIYNKTSIFQAYGYYSKKEDRAFIKEDRSHNCPWDMQEVMPATKKQRDLLWSKIEEPDKVIE